MDDLHNKKSDLENILRDMGRVVVAFSAGVDSTFLLKTAHDVLGENAIAVTVSAPFVPQEERNEARDFCKAHGIVHRMLEVHLSEVSCFADNPPDRCYHCKRSIFTKIKQTARELGADCVAEGTNADDGTDYRPGMKAIAELGIESPLKRAGLTKAEIRQLSREMGLEVWKKPSLACLATRIAYHEAITEEKLEMVGKAERRLRDMGFGQLRVRMHGDSARIEICRDDFEKMLAPDTADEISRYFKELGFMYVSLDLDGYHTGSMNRAITV